MIDPVCIKTFAYPHEAEVAASTLEAHGIDVRIGSEDASDTVMGALGTTGARMFVEAVDVDRAIDILTGSSMPDGEERKLSATVTFLPPVTRSSILTGSLWIVVGVAVTVGTYALSGPRGTFVIAYGAVVYGVIQVVRGVYALMKSDSTDQTPDA